IMRKMTLELKASAVGSFWPNELPHMAHPCANADVARAASAASTRTIDLPRRVVMASIEVHERKEHGPERGHEVPIDRAHLQARVRLGTISPAVGEQGDQREPGHCREDV